MRGVAIASLAVAAEAFAPLVYGPSPSSGAKPCRAQGTLGLRAIGRRPDDSKVKVRLQKAVLCVWKHAPEILRWYCQSHATC